MKRSLLVVLSAAVAIVSSSGAPLSAQPAREMIDVIVVLNDATPFEGYVSEYRPDDRARANPAAWGYVPRGVAGFVQSLERRQGFRATHVFGAALRGFSARLTVDQIRDLEIDPAVASIEPDGLMSTVEQTLPWGVDRVDADLSPTALAGDGAGAVAGAYAYVIDTGIDIAHPDLHVAAHVNFAGGQNTDCNGHGTHVAGTIGALDNGSDVVGMAPGLPLIGVKVLGCNGSGSTSAVIKGVDWVTAHAVRPAVANMSLGGSASAALDAAVVNSANAGIFYAVAAGNSGVDACTSSPARAGAGSNNGIMTTAAVDIAEVEPWWSNFGSCIDIWAPGVSILSTRTNGGTTTLSGTSMASPHVAGAGALFLASRIAAPAELEFAIKYFAQATGTLSKNGAAIKRLWVRYF